MPNSALASLFTQLEAELAAHRTALLTGFTPANFTQKQAAYVAFDEAATALEATVAKVRTLLPPAALAPTMPAVLPPAVPAPPAPAAPLPPGTTGPHDLTDPTIFENTRPEAFVWAGVRYGIGSGLKQRAHRAVYEWVLHHLYQQDAARLRGCLKASAFTSQQGHPDFALTPAGLREAYQIAPDFFAEVNLSAPHIAQRLRRLLEWFGLPPTTLLLWVRPTAKKKLKG